MAKADSVDSVQPLLVALRRVRWASDAALEEAARLHEEDPDAPQEALLD